MNKKEFINKLMEVTGLTEEKCHEINEVIEKYFIIGKNNKEKILNDLKEKLNYTEKEADQLYNKVMDIITKEIKEKIINPFKSND